MIHGKLNFNIGAKSKGFSFSWKNPMRRDFSPTLSIWRFTVLSLPERGSMLEKGKHFKGIWMTWCLSSTMGKVIKVPRLLKRFIRYDCVCIPYKWKINVLQ